MHNCMTLCVSCAVGFRQAFCQVALERNTGSDQSCPISRLMLHDARMFKGKELHFHTKYEHNANSITSNTNMFLILSPEGARKTVHELIFCSMLMETEFKRLFAIEFTKVKKKGIYFKLFLCLFHFLK